MPKIREKKTLANLVYYYKFNTLTIPGELDAWFVKFLSSAENLVQFGAVRLSNLHSSHAEDGGPEELTIREVRNGILQPMRNAHANRLAVHFTYEGASMVLGLTLGEWVVSLAARRSDADKLDNLVSRLSLDQA